MSFMSHVARADGPHAANKKHMYLSGHAPEPSNGIWAFFSHRLGIPPPL